MCREWTRPPAARAVKRWAGMEMDLTITGDQANDALTGAVPVVLLRRYRERHAVLTVHGRALGTVALCVRSSPRDSGYLSTQHNHREGDQR